MGYKPADGDGDAQGPLENTDVFVGRMNGYVMFYAAMLQVDMPGQGSDGMISHAWAWMARMLNHLPVKRLHISALEVFLKVAGFRLNQVYRRQFQKLLATVTNEYIPKMQSLNDADARAATTRLASYIQAQEFFNSPEGRDMPEQDESSITAC